LLKYDSATSLWKNSAQSTLAIANTQVSGLGTASTKNIPATGNASATEVVYGTDTRLTNSRTPTTHASTHGSGGSDAITIAPAQVTGTAVITTDSRLSNARTPTAHASTHASGGSDAITIAPAQVTGTAVITTDSRLSDARTPLSHTHGNISNTGTVTTSVTATNPVKVLITDTSNIAGTLTTTGASATTFLRGDGTWATPAGGGGGGGWGIKPATGYYYSYVPYDSYNATAMGLVANRVYASPFVVASSVTATRIAINCEVATVGSLLRLGIYSSAAGSDTPSARLLDAGTVATNTTGWKAITISQALTAGTYWLVALQVTGSTGGNFSAGPFPGFSVMTPTSTTASPGLYTTCGFYMNSQSSLPATFTATGVNTSVTPIISLGF
jgi:hypothetical protein